MCISENVTNKLPFHLHNTILTMYLTTANTTNYVLHFPPMTAITTTRLLLLLTQFYKVHHLHQYNKSTA